MNLDAERLLEKPGGREQVLADPQPLERTEAGGGAAQNKVKPSAGRLLPN